MTDAPRRSFVKLRELQRQGFTSCRRIAPEALEAIGTIPAAFSEIMFVAHISPIIIVLADKPRFDLIVAPSLLRQVPLAPDGRWLAPYQPIHMRTLGFQLVGDGEGPLDRLSADLNAPIWDAKGERLFSDDGHPAPMLNAIYHLLRSSADSVADVERVADALLTAGLAVPFVGDGQRRLSDVLGPKRCFTVTAARLQAMEPVVLERLVQASFASVEVAYAIALSRRFLGPGLAPAEAVPPGGKQTEIIAPAPIGGFAFDDSELFSLP